MSASTRPEHVLQPGPYSRPARPAARPRTAKAKWNVWLRWLHTYTSMISLLVVLFFSITGITLNHPDWLFGTGSVQREVTGTLPTGWRQNGEVNWLRVAEELRAAQGLRGRVGETRADQQEASVSFAAPGYTADAFINVSTGAYSVNILEQGSVAVLNDLHKGRDAGIAWKWVIDLSGAVLTLVSLTGIGILLLLKKTRRQALTVMGLAGLLTVFLALRAVT